MKHAILILSSYGIDYLVNNIRQYAKYQDVFDIFIHVDGKTYSDIKIAYENKAINIVEYVSDWANMSNIKYVGHEYSGWRFSFELVLMEMHLFKRAIENGGYNTYHLTSDSCYLYKDIDVFLDFFGKNPDTNLIGLGMEFKKEIFDESLGLEKKYKSSQWLSLSHKTLSKIIETNLFDKIYQDWRNGLIDSPNYEGAYDEVVLQTYIANHIFNNINEENFWQARYVLWADASPIGSPNTLDINLLERDIELDEWELNNAFWCRKIDYKNEKSMNFLNYLKKNYGNKKIEK